MPGTCKTCKWWEVDGGGDSVHYCNHKKVGPNGDAFTDGAMDSEGYGGIFTGPDFGCIHHEPTSEETS